MGIHLYLRQGQIFVGYVNLPYCVNRWLHKLGCSAAHLDMTNCRDGLTQLASLLRRLEGTGPLDSLPDGATCWCCSANPSKSQIRYAVHHYLSVMRDLATTYVGATWQIYLPPLFHETD
jgi:hypothetical protein